MSQPFEVFGSQNKSDDDGQVIDSFFVETDSPPPLEDAEEPIVVRVFSDPKITTRVLSVDLRLTPTSSPVRLFPEDINRTKLIVAVLSETSVVTDGIRLASGLTEVYSAGRLLHTPNGMSVDLSDHTGEVWVTSAKLADNGPASGNVWVQVWAVTS